MRGVWVISGRDSGHKAFLKELQNSFWRHGVRKQRSHTTPCSKSGWAGGSDPAFGGVPHEFH